MVSWLVKPRRLCIQNHIPCETNTKTLRLRENNCTLTATFVQRLDYSTLISITESLVFVCVLLPITKSTLTPTNKHSLSLSLSHTLSLPPPPPSLSFSHTHSLSPISLSHTFSLSVSLALSLSMHVCVCRVRCSSIKECPLIVHWVIRSIPHGIPTELFLVSASASQLV